MKNDGNSPLHILAGLKEYPINSTIGDLLFDYGAQPYQVNKEGKTAVDVWMQTNCGEEGELSTAWINRPHWCRNIVLTLKSLSAKTIHNNRISYSPDDLPLELVSFLDEH